MVILIILAGVATNLSIGENGLFKKAQTVKEQYINGQYEEEIGINSYVNEILGVDTYRSEINYRDEPSEIITDFNIRVTKNLATSITVKVTNIDTTNDSNVKGYIYFINNKVVKVSEKSECKLEGLTKETFYDGIFVLAIDENGKLKKSANTIELTTEKYIFAQWKSYYNKTGTYESELKDNAGFIENGNSIQVQETGTYHVNYAWWTLGSSSGSNCARIYKNGTVIKTLDVTYNTKTSGTFDINLNEGDIIVVKQYTDNGQYPTSLDLVLYYDVAPIQVSV